MDDQFHEDATNQHVTEFLDPGARMTPASFGTNTIKLDQSTHGNGQNETGILLQLEAHTETTEIQIKNVSFMLIL